MCLKRKGLLVEGFVVGEGEEVMIADNGEREGLKRGLRVLWWLACWWYV